MNARDSTYINRLRGASILRVVLGHLGLGWVFLPYSSYIGMFLPILFFCSGFIFIYLFSRAATIKEYLFKRILGVVIPFYLVYFFSLASSAIINSGLSSFTLYDFFQILIIAPDISDMPYPLGQIWYLRVLLFCTLISPILFLVAKNNKYWLLLPMVIAVIFASIQTNYKFHRLFYFFGHNLYQEILYGAYFFIGSFIYCIPWRDKKSPIIFAALACLLISVSAFYFWDLDINLGNHAFAPNLLYFPLGMAGILLVLLFVEQIEWLLNRLPYLSKILDFCSTHSYGIYLNHSFFIIFYENVFNLKGVIDKPLLAFIKIILVLASSMLFAIPITSASKYLIMKTRRNIDRGKN